MSRIALSAFVWGVYLVGAGLGFLIFPNLVLPIFGFPTTGEVWIRVVGLLVAVLGGYYLFAASNRVIPFIRITVPGRLVFALGIVVLVASRLADPSLLIFGVLDALGALWTWMALTSQPANTAIAPQACHLAHLVDGSAVKEPVHTVAQIRSGVRSFINFGSSYQRFKNRQAP